MKLDVCNIVKKYEKCNFRVDEIAKELGIPREYQFDYNMADRERTLTSAICIEKVSDKGYRTTKGLFIWVDELGNISFRCIPRTGLKREEVNEMSAYILDFISKWKEYIIFE